MSRQGRINRTSMQLKTFNEYINESTGSSDREAKTRALCLEITRLINLEINGEDSDRTLTARWVPGDWAEHRANMRTEVSIEISDRGYLAVNFDYYLVSRNGEHTGAVSAYGEIRLNFSENQYSASEFPTLDSYSESVDWQMEAPWDSEFRSEMFSGSGDLAGETVEFSAKQKYEDAYPQIIANHLVSAFRSVNGYFQEELDGLEPSEDEEFED